MVAMTQKCSSAVNSLPRWPKNVVLPPTLGLGGPKTVNRRQILASMALTPGSDRLASWLQPPVQPYMEAYAFHIKNPDEVLEGKKPHVEEVGPFVYRYCRGFSPAKVSFAIL